MGEDTPAQRALPITQIGDGKWSENNRDVMKKLFHALFLGRKAKEKKSLFILLAVCPCVEITNSSCLVFLFIDASKNTGKQFNLAWWWPNYL